MSGGGFVLALGGFFASLAAIDSANPYGPMGASRTRMVGFLAEPVFMVVFFTVAFVADSTIPYIVQQKWLEFSGPGAALMKWGGQMKFFVLLCIFLNVLVTPWGLASGHTLAAVVLAIPLVLLKILLFLILLMVIESSLSKLRLFRIAEFLGAAFIISVMAMISRVFSA